MLLYNDNNKAISSSLVHKGDRFDLIYCDCIYEDHDLDYLDNILILLNGVLIIQTDHHTLSDYLHYLESRLYFVNHLAWKNEWGNHPKDRFHQCFDDILIYSTYKSWRFDSNKVQVPKATVNSKLNPSGRQTKTATAFIDDICLTTTSKERVKLGDHLVRWQKPYKLMDRIISPFVVEGNKIYDPFMGTGTLGVYCAKNNLNYVGVESDKDIYNIAVNRINNLEE